MTNVVKFRRQYTPDYKGTPYQNETGVSMTVPSMTLTVKELMERHTRGLETDTAQREEIYLPEGIDVPRMDDLTDLVFAKEELKQKEDEIKQQIAAERDIQQKAKLEQEEKAKNEDSKEFERFKRFKAAESIPPLQAN